MLPLRIITPLLTLVLALGCGSSPAPQGSVATPAAGPTIQAFGRSKASVSEGGRVNLTWQVEGATELVLDPGHRTVTGLGTLTVVPAATTTYTLTAKGPTGQRTATTTVTVTAAAGVPEPEHMAVQPQGILAGEEALLTWVSPTATSLQIEPGAREAILENPVVLKPASTTTYTLTFRNSKGTATRQVTVPVLAPGALPQIPAFRAHPASVAAGDTVTLSWEAHGARSLRLEPGGLDVSGTTSCFVVPMGNTTYRLVAQNATGTQEATLSVAPSGVAPSQRFPHQQLLEDVRVLASPAMEGRKVGSSGSALARTYLRQRMTALGLQPFGASLEAPWQRGGYSGVNLVGRILGTQHPDKVFVIGGHYDHIGRDDRGLVCPGADDNASGAAAVLAVAAHFAAHPPAHTLVFALFDGEEMGLHGSYAFTEQPPLPLGQIQLMVNFDMVSRADYGKVGVAGTTALPGLRPLVSAAAAGRPWPVSFGHEQYLAYSDQYPFYRKGIPYLWFFCVDHPDYHTWRDTYERIHPDYFRHLMEIAVGTLQSLDALPALPAAQPEARPAAPEATFPIGPETWHQLGRIQE